MESDMVENSWAKSNIDIVSDFFQENIDQFKLIDKKMHGPYWSMYYMRNDIKIHIGGDIGFHISLYIDDTKYLLWQYDRSVNDKLETSKENILYQLNVLKRFLNEVGY
jgi:hypothetical protein